MLCLKEVIDYMQVKMHFTCYVKPNGTNYEIKYNFINTSNVNEAIKELLFVMSVTSEIIIRYHSIFLPNSRH
jgi:hypothetical protein